MVIFSSVLRLCRVDVPIIMQYRHNATQCITEFPHDGIQALLVGSAAFNAARRAAQPPHA